jgi:uncharacterized YccA/Bax inhibitor family protein
VANPILNDKVFEEARVSASGSSLPPPDAATRVQPMTDGPITPYRAFKPMTLDGTLASTGILFVLLLGAAIWGWNLVGVSTNPTTGASEVTTFPTWSLFAILIGFGAVMLASFRPHLARFLAPVYAIAQGVFVGAISAAYNVEWNGIVIQAVGATLGVFFVMLFLYRFRIVRVTDKFRSVVIGATMGLAVFYLIALVMSLFGANIAFLSSASLFGIGFSVLAAGLASLNLLLDFDIIERGVKGAAPRYMEWFAGMALLVTLVWLYLELLRLLAKLRSR